MKTNLLFRVRCRGESALIRATAPYQAVFTFRDVIEERLGSTFLAGQIALVYSLTEPENLGPGLVYQAEQTPRLYHFGIRIRRRAS